MKRAISAATLLVLLDGGMAMAQSTVYVGGHFRRNRPTTVTNLKASGFNTVILFNVDVDSSGNLSMDGQALCTNGSYVFGSTNPNYVSDVTSLKSGSTWISRIECCVGGWGNKSYNNIKSLINASGAGSGTNLYRNFQALKSAIPAIDAINNDDESCYDVSTATSFHVMLANLGYKTTLAPYMNYSFWNQLATNVNNQKSGTVDRVYIQCYEGGAGNNPSDWHLGGIPLHAGLENFDTTATVASQMTNWKNNCGVVGGFLWVYNDETWSLSSYAGTINNVFTPNPVATFFRDCNYEGSAVRLGVGDYPLSALKARGINNDDISSLKVTSGYKAVLYWDDNYSGSSLEVTADNSCLVGQGWNDQVSSLRLAATTASWSTKLEAESYVNMSGVATETCSEGGSNVGWIDAGDWMVWDVNIPSAGTYKIEYRVSSPNTGGKIQFEKAGGSVIYGTVTVPNTGSWQTWQTVSHYVSLSAGQQQIAVAVPVGGYNLNWLRISK